MLIRWVTKEDKPAWLELSKEYDAYVSELTEDMSRWYDGFNVYMDSKINKFNAICAVSRMSGKINGVLAFSKTKNSITFFAINKTADFDNTADKLLTVALRQLDTHKDIYVWLPQSENAYLQKAVYTYLKKGFTIDSDGTDGGVIGKKLVRLATTEKRGGSFHYDYDGYNKYSKVMNCLCCNNAPAPASNVDIVEFKHSYATAERDAQGRLFGKCHVLIKRHYVNLEDIPFEYMAGFMSEVQLVGKALRKVTGAIKINYEIHANSGPHIHCHLFPRYLDDDFASAPIDYRIYEPSPYESDEEFNWFVEQMRKELNG